MMIIWDHVMMFPNWCKVCKANNSNLNIPFYAELYEIAPKKVQSPDRLSIVPKCNAHDNIICWDI